jgi:hypothetical protein
VSRNHPLPLGERVGERGSPQFNCLGILLDLRPQKNITFIAKLSVLFLDQDDLTPAQKKAYTALVHVLKKELKP